MIERASGRWHLFLRTPGRRVKQERMQGLIKQECIRPKCPRSPEEARKIVNEYVKYYNEKRLHSAIGYIAPKDMPEGRQREIHLERKQRLQEAREKRKAKRLLEKPRLS